jgi:methyl-accepting chemotaxis protein
MAANVEGAVSHLPAHLSIRSKIIAGFAVVLICTIGLGLFSTQRLDAVNGNAQHIRDNYLPGTRILGRLAQVSERLRSNRGSLLLATTDVQRTQYGSTIKQQAALYARAREDYQPLVSAGDEQRLTDAFDAAWKRYLEISDATAGLMAQGKRDDAIALFLGEGAKAIATFRDALQADIDLNVLGGTRAADAGAALGASAHRWILAVLVLAALLCVAIGWTIIRGISSPISAMAAAMHRLAGGDTAVEIVGAGRGDEIGAMAKAVAVFRQNAVERVRLEAEQKQQEQRAAQEKQDALISMAERIEAETTAGLEGIGSRSETMAATAEAMRASAGRTGDAAQSAAAAAAQSLANAQTVASAAEQLTASIHEIGGQVNQSNQVVGRAVAAGVETRAKMEALNEQVGRIGAVAVMISEIAAKTNLLALNATIEAARAGDAGKGFAVVASEVKQLATQTARSTEEITRHISEVRSAAGESVTSVQQIEQTIGEINAIAGSIAAAVEEQGAATAEIARNVAATAAAADTMTNRTAEVSTEAAQTGHRAVDVLENTIVLNASVETLRRAVIHVVRTSSAEVDRREYRRRPCLADATVDGQGQSAKAVIRDIAESGCLVETPLRCQAGQQIELALSRFGIRMKGSVVHASDGRLRMAFVGDGLPAGDADRISLETIPELVKLAKNDHADFVKKVVDAVEARAKPQHGSLATAHHCRLGRWYDGVSDHATLELASFKAIEDPHHAVHDAGRKALAALSIDDLPTAQQEVAAMREASTRVLQALDAFGREYPSAIRADRQMLPEIASRTVA